MKTEDFIDMLENGLANHFRDLIDKSPDKVIEWRGLKIQKMPENVFANSKEGFEESIKESLKKIKIWENHDPNSFLNRCDVCGSTDIIVSPVMGLNCNSCNPLKK